MDSGGIPMDSGGIPMDSGVIRITVAEFDLMRPQQHPPPIIEAIAEMLNKTLLLRTIPPPPPPSNIKWNRATEPSSKWRTPSSSTTSTTPSRMLLAALNKLSTKNFVKITKHVLSIASTTSMPPSELVDSVLSKSAMDTGYADIYVRMIHDVLMGLPLEKADCARSLLATHVSNTLSAAIVARQIGLIADIPTGSAKDYDDLCASVKAVKHFYGCMATAFALVVHFRNAGNVTPLPKLFPPTMMLIPAEQSTTLLPIEFITKILIFSS